MSAAWTKKQIRLTIEERVKVDALFSDMAPTDREAFLILIEYWTRSHPAHPTLKALLNSMHS